MLNMSQNKVQHSESMTNQKKDCCLKVPAEVSLFPDSSASSASRSNCGPAAVVIQVKEFNESALNHLSPVPSPGTEQTTSISSGELFQKNSNNNYAEKSTLPFSTDDDESVRALNKQKQQIGAHKVGLETLKAAIYQADYGSLYDSVSNFWQTLTQQTDISKCPHRLESVCQDFVKEIVSSYGQTSPRRYHLDESSIGVSLEHKQDHDRILAIIETCEEQKEYIQFLQQNAKAKGLLNIRQDYMKTHTSPRLRESFLRDQSQASNYSKSRNIEFLNQISKRKTSPMFSPVHQLNSHRHLDQDSQIKIGTAFYSPRNRARFAISNQISTKVMPDENLMIHNQEILSRLLINYKTLHRKFVEALHCSWVLLVRFSSIFTGNPHSCWKSARNLMDSVKDGLEKHAAWYTTLKTPKQLNLSLAESVFEKYSTKSKPLYDYTVAFGSVLQQISDYGNI